MHYLNSLFVLQGVPKYQNLQILGYFPSYLLAFYFTFNMSLNGISRLSFFFKWKLLYLWWIWVERKILRLNVTFTMTEIRNSMNWIILGTKVLLTKVSLDYCLMEIWELLTKDNATFKNGNGTFLIHSLRFSTLRRSLTF